MSTRRGRSNNPQPIVPWPHPPFTRKRPQQPSPSEIAASRYRMARRTSLMNMRLKIRRDRREEQ